jgi:histone H3/H4
MICRFPRVFRILLVPPLVSSSDLIPATVQKIVTEILPPSAGVAFAKEARDLLIECCVEFITLISSEANEISEKEAKKTIACDHITKALEQLGFSDYVPAVLEAAAEHKEVQKVVRVTPLPPLSCKQRD